MNDKEKLIVFEEHKDECRFGHICVSLGCGFSAITCTSLQGFIKSLIADLYSFEDTNNIENLSKHFVGYNDNPFNQDIFSKLHYAEKEHLIVLLLNENSDVIEYKTVCIGDSMSVGSDSTENTLKYLKEKNAHKFILIHNHPWNVCAVPSEGDLMGIEKIKNLAAYEGFELADYCIFTIYDFWSYKQCVEEGKLNFYIERYKKHNEKYKKVLRYLSDHKAEISENYKKLTDEGKELYEKFKDIK